MKKMFFYGLVCLFFLSCSLSSPNNTVKEKYNFADLEKEYKSFNTKALSDAYVLRMFNKYLITTPSPSQVIRQLEFARYLKANSDSSYFNSIKTVISNDNSVYNKITGFTEVSQKMTSESGTFGTFVQSLSPIPVAPVATSATLITSASFTANWNTIANATGYKLYIDGSLAYTGTALSYNKTGLSAGSSYTYYVQATNAAGTSTNSNTVNVLLNPPAPVANAASSITTTSFSANWTAVSGATGYKLIVDGGTPVVLGTVTTYSVTGLTPGATHTYYLQAVNASGASLNSNTMNVNTTLSSPTANAASSITTTSFSANWTSVSGATGYKLIVDNGTPIVLGTVTTYSVTGLTPGSTHSYYVQAVSSGLTSSNSNTISATLLLSAPTANAASSITTTSFTANWSGVSGATGYNLYFDSSLAYSGTSTSYNKTGLTPGSIHSYYVQAVNGGVTSPASNTISATLLLSAPTANAASSITTTSFTASWSGVSGATGYNLYIDNSLAYSGTSASYNKTGLTAGSAHNYYVHAVNGGVSSSASNIVSVTTLPVAPSAPVAYPVDSNRTTTSFVASWTLASGATTYDLYVDDALAFSGFDVSYNKTGLSYGVHRFYVVARNSGGSSPASNVITVIVGPAGAVTGGYILESSHPYTDSLNQTKSAVLTFGTGEPIFTFGTFDSSTYTEPGYDFINIMSGGFTSYGTFSGSQLAGYSLFCVTSTTFRIKLTSDVGSTFWGYKAFIEK